ncbi:hypothetical protein L484_002633 [Morus notabilis]|uniref:Uncharacterized protein n=1 Tax=Morus notabilis TaxID=981085 RepID=W9SAU3_9ROSA|nr:hypothetical protein L484_002633 [Morus notabilis]
MGDAIDFCVHISTPIEKIATIKERIKSNFGGAVAAIKFSYIQSRSDHWHPDPILIMKDVEDLNKLRFSVWLTHRMNHQNIGERWTRRALLVEEMIKVFRELDIEYRMLPLDVNVRSLPSCNSDDSPSTSMWELILRPRK